MTTAMMPLNRKPTTLAQRLSPEQWRNIAECAYQRHRTYSGIQDYDRCSREWQSWETGIAMANLAADPFPIKVGEGVKHYGRAPSWDDLLIDRDWHIQQAVNAEPLQLPHYLDEAVCDEEKNWQETVVSYLQITADDRKSYLWQDFTLSGDLSGEVNAVVFYPEIAGDWIWSGDCYVAIDGKLYPMGDACIGDSCILDDRMGWYVTSLDGDLVEQGTDVLQAGYSPDPTDQLRSLIIGEPAWHYGFNCFVGRLECYPHPVRLYPEVPGYGG